MRREYPLQRFFRKFFLLAVIRTSALAPTAASKKGSSPLSGSWNDSAKAGIFVPFERMTSRQEEKEDGLCNFD